MATNRADTLDPALLRPGRLDRKIEFPLPDRRQKRLIFQTICSKMNLSEEVDLEDCSSFAFITIIYAFLVLPKKLGFLYFYCTKKINFPPVFLLLLSPSSFSFLSSIYRSLTQQLQLSRSINYRRNHL
jgi:hypothetical protein